MPQFQLRPYQDEMTDNLRAELRTRRTTCAVLATGGGKTVIFAGITASASAKNKSVWIGVHREELVEQTSNKLTDFGVPHGVIQGGRPEVNALVQIVMVQSVKSRMHRLTMPDLFIIDECHHAPSKSYGSILSCLPPASKVIGFTATPERLDGKGLGNHFESMVQGPPIQELINLGYLVPPVVYAPPGVDTSKLHTQAGDFVRREAAELMDRAQITGDIIQHYRKYAAGTAAVAFCVSIEHAEHVAEEFNQAGIPSISIDGTLSKEERRSRLAAFKDGTIQVLTSCDLISEGFDLPRIETCILLRPTRSLSLFLQQVGRSLRTDEEHGKERAVILDHVGNTARFGLPDLTRRWCLEGRKEREKQEQEEVVLKVKTCADCFCVYQGSKCPACGKEAKGDGRELVTVDGELVQVQSLRRYVMRSEYDELKSAQSLAELEAVAQRQGIDSMTAKKVLIQRAGSLESLLHLENVLKYKSGWAYYRYRARHGEEGLKQALLAHSPAALRRYRDEEFFANTRRVV